VSDHLDVLRTAYRDLASVLHGAAMDGAEWTPTGCRGWAVADLGYHLLGDARRALLGLSSPSVRQPDRDSVSYWRGWLPPDPGDDEALRRTRAMASIGIHFADLSQEYSDTTAAVLVSADRVQPSDLVDTQGWTMTVGDLRSTLTVEAAVHHLDLVLHLDRPGPAAAPLAEVRRVLEGLLGRPLPPGWDDVTAARRGTGREPLTDGDRSELGAAADAFPLFG
jgi:hypothetical protein